MKVIAINGSPRKTWNTATLLNKALEGAASTGAQTELIHLYDLNFKGCTSCFACKLKGGKSYGRCAYKDDLTPVLEKVAQADALILGSPVYIGVVSGEMRSFIERLLFPYLVYGSDQSLAPKKLNCGFIYTMGSTEERIELFGLDKQIMINEAMLSRQFGGASESLVVVNTYQFNDYSKYVHDFDVEDKTKTRREVFPLDCKKAFDMGVRLTKA